MLSRRAALKFFLVAAAVAALVAAETVVNAQGQGTQPPPAPQSLTLDVAPGTTRVSASWDAAPGADSYQVRWRPRRGSFAAGNLVTVARPAVTLTVEQGSWVVRVQACNSSGCGRPATASVRVIINIPGHEAVRSWTDERGFHLDWDPLPGRYVVKYRIAGWDAWPADHWDTLPPQSEVGYTEPVIAPDSITAEEKARAAEFLERHPFPVEGVTTIYRVFFNCDAAGEGCELLGRMPNNTLESIYSDSPRAHDEAVGASGSAASPELLGDPMTGMIRDDLTLTYEVLEDGATWSCVSRPAENPWERAMAGGSVVKSCHKSEIEDKYLYDPEAAFENGARCGTRPAADDAEREYFGDTVKVCNSHDDASETGDDAAAVTGQTHTSTYLTLIRKIGVPLHLEGPGRWADWGAQVGRLLMLLLWA